MQIRDNAISLIIEKSIDIKKGQHCVDLQFEPPVGIEPTIFPILHRDALSEKV